MKLIYTHENQFLVRNVQNILNEAGIDSVLKNQFSSGGVGELSPIDSWPELWLTKEEDFELAKTMIAEVYNDHSLKEWQCEHCGEINGGAFEVCWNCSSDTDEN